MVTVLFAIGLRKHGLGVNRCIYQKHLSQLLAPIAVRTQPRKHCKPYYLEAPPCTLLVSPPAATESPRCQFTAGWEAFYWPTVGLMGSAFCNANATGIPSTPTIPGTPNTAVISGSTLTSPSVYHFFHNATVSTYVGLRSRIGDLFPTSSFALSSAMPSQSALTVAQVEGDILNEHLRCGGSGSKKHCVHYFSKDFVLHDLETVRASKLMTGCGSCWGNTVYQNAFTPTVGIPLTQIARQNHAFTDCRFKMSSTY